MAKRTKKLHYKRFLPELLLALGIFLVTISVTHNVLKLRSLRLDQTVVQEYLDSQVQVKLPNYPTHITIPWFVDVEIDPQVYQDGSWTVSSDHASYLTASSLPGQPGNIIIYGHNKRNIMGNIRALKGYEKITLTMADGTERIYQVQSIQEVNPTNVKLLSPTESEFLTLYTCSGFLDSQRFVVRAIPIN